MSPNLRFINPQRVSEYNQVYDQNEPPQLLSVLTSGIPLILMSALIPEGWACATTLSYISSPDSSIVSVLVRVLLL